MRLVSLFLFVFSLTNICNAQSDSAKYVVPATSLADLSMMTPPEGFVVGTGFNGYYHPLTQATIIMTYIENVNYVNIERSMTDEYFLQNKMTRHGNFDIKCDSGLTGVGYKASFTIDGIEMMRHIVFIGTLNSTLWLSVTFPVENQKLVESELLKAYTTVQFPKK